MVVVVGIVVVMVMGGRGVALLLPFSHTNHSTTGPTSARRLPQLSHSDPKGAFASLARY